MASVRGCHRMPLDREWFARHPVPVAHDLVGAWIEVDRDGLRVRARIVETEAYGGMEDGASHATMYQVGRETLGHQPGVLYMQFAYGMHTMTNIVSHDPEMLGAVLLRAAEDPVEGIETARLRRGHRDKDLLVGPGNLSRGLGTHLSDTLKPLGADSALWLCHGESVAQVLASPRIGISRAIDVPWRFFDRMSGSVSKHRRGIPVDPSGLEAIVNAPGPTLSR